MKTEQEQIEKMAEKMKRCFEKNGLLNFKWFAEALVQAGYGDVSEYEAEIKQLKAKNNVLGDGVAKAFTNGFNTGRKQVEKDIRRAQIDVLNELKGRVRTSYVLDDFILGNVVFSKDIDELIEEIKNDNTET